MRERRTPHTGVNRLLRRMASGLWALYRLATSRKARTKRREERRFRHCIADDRPYFGLAMASGQESRQRYSYMQALVARECSRKGGGDYRVLEVGSWAGGSAIVWADALKKRNDGNGCVICVDPWVPYCGDYENEVCRIMEGALQTGEIVELFLHNIRTSGHDDIIKMIKAKSDEILPLLKHGEFDLVFLDGSHEYQQVMRDLENASPLLRHGGILCGDDLEVQASATDVQYARANSEKDTVRDPMTKDWFHPGVTLAVADWFGGEVSAWEGFWAMRKKQDGWEDVVDARLDTGDVRIPECLAQGQG